MPPLFPGDDCGLSSLPADDFDFVENCLIPLPPRAIFDCPAIEIPFDPPAVDPLDLNIPCPNILGTAYVTATATGATVTADAYLAITPVVGASSCVYNLNLDLAFDFSVEGGGEGGDGAGCVRFVYVELDVDPGAVGDPIDATVLHWLNRGCTLPPPIAVGGAIEVIDPVGMFPYLKAGNKATAFRDTATGEYLLTCGQDAAPPPPIDTGLADVFATDDGFYKVFKQVPTTPVQWFGLGVCSSGSSSNQDPPPPNPACADSWSPGEHFSTTTAGSFNKAWRRTGGAAASYTPPTFTGFDTAGGKVWFWVAAAQAWVEQTCDWIVYVG